MKKSIKILAFACLLSIQALAYTPLPTDLSLFTKMELTFKYYDPTTIAGGTHRTPPAIPNVYLDQENVTLYFENACYDCNIQLVVPGTDNVVYTDVIPDGDNIYVLPNLSGTYELRIIRGDYMFVGEITL